MPQGSRTRHSRKKSSTTRAPRKRERTSVSYSNKIKAAEFKFNPPLLGHFHHHYDPKIKSKASRISKASSSYAKPDHLEVLKDENKTLKNRQNELEHDI